MNTRRQKNIAAGIKRLLLAATTTLAFGAIARADECQDGWLPGDGAPGLPGNASIWATTTWDPDGEGPLETWLVVGGSFEVAGDTPVRNIVAWDGVRWHSLGNALEYRVSGLTVHQGSIFATSDTAGSGGGLSRAVFRRDGELWTQIGQMPSSTTSFASDPMRTYGKDLIVGGRFTEIDGVAASNVARWDGQAWNPLGSGISGFVTSLVEYEGELIAAGAFTSAGGTPAFNVAAWNGTAWRALGAGVGTSNSLTLASALHVFGGQLIAVGGFTTSGSTSVNRVAAWDGEAWTPLGAGLSGRVWDVRDFNGELVACGPFSEGGPIAFERVVAWDGVSWRALGGSFSGSGSIAYRLASFQSSLYATGTFFSISDMPASAIARWNGAAWNEIPNRGMNRELLHFTEHQGALVAVGQFTAAGDEPSANRVARWNGSSWSALGAGLPPAPRAVASYAGDVYVGGSFPSDVSGMNDVVRRWNGTTWQPIATSNFPTVGANALAVYDGELIAGGDFVFSAPPGITISRLGRWDGSSWRSIGIPGPGQSVRAITVHAGKLIIGGSFQNFGSADGDRIASWDGAAWSPVGTGIANASVTCLTSYAGTLVAGGAGIVRAGSTDVQGIAQWDGTHWLALGPGLSGVIGSNWSLNALVEYDGDLYAGGTFVSSGSASLRYLGRWDGTAWSSVDGGVNGPVQTLFVYEDDLWIGGDFSRAGGLISCYWARYRACPDTFALGDMNCDGFVTVADIGGFVLALTDQAGYAALFPECDIGLADVNADGFVTVADIRPFVELLTGP